MGNTYSNNKAQGHHYNHHTHTSTNKKINEHVEAFVKWFQQNEQLNCVNLLKYFCNSNIIRILFTEYKSELKNDEIDPNYLCRFLDDASNAYSTATIAQVYIDHIFGDDSEGLEAKLELSLLREIIYDCLICTLKYIDVNNRNPNSISIYAKKTLNSLVTSLESSDLMLKQNDSEVGLFIKKIAFKNWIFNEFPDLFYGFHNWLIKRFHDKCFVQLPENEEVQSNDLSNFMNSTIAWYFCFNLPATYIRNLDGEKNCPLERMRNCLIFKKWKILFSSDSNGLSLNRFTNSLFNYKAATILFVYCKNGACYCVCTGKEYKESPVPYGDPQTRIYQVWPQFKNYDLNEPSKSIYLNTRSRGLRLGLIFGDNEKKPIVRIDEDFQYVTHELHSNDLLISIEVWACGSTKELQDQNAMKQWERKQIDKMQTAKLNADWGGDADKAILDLAGIETNHAKRGDI